MPHSELVGVYLHTLQYTHITGSRISQDKHNLLRSNYHTEPCSDMSTEYPYIYSVPYIILLVLYYVLIQVLEAIHLYMHMHPIIRTVYLVG